MNKTIKFPLIISLAVWTIYQKYKEKWLLAEKYH
jgi:hypothetical protein